MARHAGVWTRPALLLVLATIVLAVAAVPGLGAAEAYRAGRALDRGVVCADGAGDCLRRVPIRLESELGPGEDYPYPATTHTWVYRMPDGAGTSFAVGASAARALARLPHTRVDGLFYGDHLLAVETGAGSRVETAYAGPRGAFRSALFTLGLVAVALLLVAAAAGRRRSVGSWWSAAPGRPDYSGAPGVTRLVGWTLLAMIAAGLVPFAFGGLAWLSLALMVAALGGAVVVTRRRPEPSQA